MYKYLLCLFLVACGNVELNQKCIGSCDINGYDIEVLSKGLFNLLQTSEIISRADAKYLSNVSIYGFGTSLAVRLAVNKSITNEQANQCLDASQNSGGILVSGSNPLVLDACLMDKLLENGLIKQEDGQKILDDARVYGQ